MKISGKQCINTQASVGTVFIHAERLFSMQTSTTSLSASEDVNHRQRFTLHAAANGQLYITGLIRAHGREVSLRAQTHQTQIGLESTSVQFAVAYVHL